MCSDEALHSKKPIFGRVDDAPEREPGANEWTDTMLNLAVMNEAMQLDQI